jgi:catechol-2,3-dioxygenase
MNTQNQTLKTNFSIHPATRMGHVSLTVANLDNQVSFFTQVLGF